LSRPSPDARSTRSANPLGLTQFGVNLVTLGPRSGIGMKTRTSFIYVLEGEVTLITDEGETVLRRGMAAGFRAGAPDGHHLVNRGRVSARYLEVGTRAATEEVHYSDMDMRGSKRDGKFALRHKNGEPYP